MKSGCDCDACRIERDPNAEVGEVYKVRVRLTEMGYLKAVGERDGHTVWALTAFAREMYDRFAERIFDMDQAQLQ
jgi:hypothetical protein